MPTLMLIPRYSEDAQSLWRAATKIGWNVERLLNWRLSNKMQHGVQAYMVAIRFVF